MDPIGLSVGVVGLAGLVTTCIQAFSIFRGMRAFGRDQEVLCTKLDIEKASLIQWAQQVGLLRRNLHEEGKKFLFDPFVDKTIHKVLKEIVLLLNDGHKLQRKYGLLAVDQSQANFETDKLSRHRMRQLALYDPEYDREIFESQKRRKVGLGRKFIWTIHEKDEFNDLIGQLEYFIGKLYQMIPRVEARKMVNEDLQNVAMGNDLRTLRLIEEAARGSHKDWSDLASQFADDTETAVSTIGEPDKDRKRRRRNGSSHRRRRSKSRYDYDSDYYDDYEPYLRERPPSYYRGDSPPSYSSHSGHSGSSSHSSNRSSGRQNLVDMMSDMVARRGSRPVSSFYSSSS